MRERVVAALVRARQHNRHVELAPALLLDLERRLLERLLVLLKRRVQVVHGLFEARRGHVVAGRVDEPDLDGPAAHREALHRGGLADGPLPRDELDGALDLGGVSGRVALRGWVWVRGSGWLSAEREDEWHGGGLWIARIRTSGMLESWVVLERGWSVGCGAVELARALSSRPSWREGSANFVAGGGGRSF